MRASQGKFGKDERDDQNRQGREEFLVVTRERMRDAGITPPEPPAELAHLDQVRP